MNTVQNTLVCTLAPRVTLSSDFLVVTFHEEPTLGYTKDINK